ncbi:recombinase family protein [Desulfosporosinus sp. FKB]|uniref:recombinase family protein n=1 Tax=Desulfosporosinus sp. FKB TaxID=1969835 RepID=UPI000B4A246B|nr:recombinase family protein [Desulfosporosinus sp. FKB]
MGYNVADIIEKTIKIAVRRRTIYENIRQDKSDIVSVKIFSSVLAKQMDKTVEYYESLLNEIKEVEFEEIDFSTYDKMSISQNMHWSNQRRFKKGKFSVSTKRLLGYDKGQDGNLIINEEQAAIVRRIFKDYLSGLGAFRIAKALEADGIKNISRKVKWVESSIRDILKNEKYAGDARLQKTITTGLYNRK